VTKIPRMLGPVLGFRMLWLLTLLAAFAAPPADLVTAADDDLEEDVRMAAFERLVQHGAYEVASIRDAALAATTPARQRWVAVRALGRIRGTDARATLVTLMADDMPAMRAAAVSATGDLNDKTLAAKVAESLKDPAIMVRAAAAEALGKLRDPRTIPALDKALGDPTNHYRGTSLWVRKHYVDALGAIGDKKALPTLLRCLDDHDESVVAATTRALAHVAGFSMADGRDAEQEREAWRRWVTTELRTNPP
jgi:HEAT repeat protein